MAEPLNLTQRTARAIGFRFLGSILDTSLSVTLAIVLARILSPREFGLFSLTLSINAIAEVVGSCGMLRALIQRKNLTPEHEAAATIYKFTSVLIISILIYFAAPSTENIFGLVGLATIMRLQIGALLLHSIALLPESRLNRRLAFDRLTVVHAGAKAVGGLIAILLALNEFGASALAFGSLASALVSTSLLWFCAPGSIPLRFRFDDLRVLMSYGSGILFINIANILTQRLDILIIGRQVGSEAIGLYQRANQLMLLPLTQVTGSIHRVLFPALTSVQSEQERFQRGYLGVVRLSALLAFPLVTGLYITAEVLIPFVYGPKWVGTVPILQVLAIAGIFRILLNTNGLVIQARGRAMAEGVQQGIWLALNMVSFGYDFWIYREPMGGVRCRSRNHYGHLYLLHNYDPSWAFGLRNSFHSLVWGNTNRYYRICPYGVISLGDEKFTTCLPTGFPSTLYNGLLRPGNLHSCYPNRFHQQRS
jgi:teichuronic acid exporter